MTVYILHFIALLQTFSFRFYANNSLVSVAEYWYDNGEKETYATATTWSKKT